VRGHIKEGPYLQCGPSFFVAQPRLEMRTGCLAFNI
jgi:hypothetical protein